MNQIKLFILLLQFWTTWSQVKWAGIQPQARGIVWTAIMKVQTREMWEIILKQSMLIQLAPPATFVELSQRPEKLWKCTKWDSTNQPLPFVKSYLWNLVCEINLKCHDRSSSLPALDDAIDEQMAKQADGNWRCLLCGNTSNKKSNTRAHVESIHLKTNGWKCEVCNKHCPSRNAYNVHFSRYHKQKFA